MAAWGRLWLIAFGGSFLFQAQPARGLGLLADDRSVSIGVSFPGCCSEFYEADFFAPFGAPYQSSSMPLDPDGLGFDGSASMRAAGFHDDSGNFHNSASVFSIGFRIDGEGSVVLDGCFESSFDASPGAAFVRFLAGDQVLFERQRDPFEPCMDEAFAFASELAPGEYTLEARTEASGTDSGVFLNFTFQVRDDAVPVPEPATGLLLLGGISALARWRAPS